MMREELDRLLEQFEAQLAVAIVQPDVNARAGVVARVFERFREHVLELVGDDA